MDNYVKILDLQTPVESELPPQFLASYPFTLDAFQQHAISALSRNENVLVTVPTSSGKTVIAEYGVHWCLEHGQRIIYTSPIKTLSNQKFAEFTRRFGTGGGGVGIITGDVKFNPEAQCLIMTTEILRDLLRKSDPLIDELGVVVFDEVHYINNEDRGHVWEQCIMMLPSRVNLILLSATISQPEELAGWIGDIKKKPINLIIQTHRPVPLGHYLFNSAEDEMKPALTPTYQELYENFRPLNQIAAINQLVRFLGKHLLFPALYFLFSRNKCQQLANSITEILLEASAQAQAEKEFDTLLRRYQYGFEYLSSLPQVREMRQLISRGVAYHHSGLLPQVKEVVEIMLASGYIKLLFVTETFSVGVNMPTRTVIFGELTKRAGDGKQRRPLYSDEFFQMAGRAGRRGLDAFGYVIYHPTRYILPPFHYWSLFTGPPMRIHSKLKMDYQSILQGITGLGPSPADSTTGAKALLANSLLGRELAQSVVQPSQQLEEIEHLLDSSGITEEDLSLVRAWLEPPKAEVLNWGKMTVSLRKCSSKEQKAADRHHDNLKKKLLQKGLIDYGGQLPEKVRRVIDGQVEKERLKAQLQDPYERYRSQYAYQVDELVRQGFLDVLPQPSQDQGGLSLTTKGIIAANVATADGLLIATMLQDPEFIVLDILNMGLLLSLLVVDRSAESEIDSDIKDTVVPPEFFEHYSWLRSVSEELSTQLSSHPSVEFSLELLSATAAWLRGQSYPQIAARLGCLEGNFVRSMTRLLRLSEELIKITSMTGKYLELEMKMLELGRLINREIVIFDSIYLKS